MLEMILKVVKEKRNLLITGGGGVGKTWHTNKIIEYLNSIGRKYAVTAMTGMASQHLDFGVTVQSFMGSGTSTDPKRADWLVRWLKEEQLETIRETETIFVDEQSMMRPDHIELMNNMLQVIHGNTKPFGGVQIIFIADYFQLAPVISREEDLGGMRWSFQTKAYADAKFVIANLTEVKRQSDVDFITVLNKTRFGIVDAQTTDFFNNAKCKFDARPTYLMAKVRAVDKMNEECLKESEGEEIEVDAIIKVHEQVKMFGNEDEIRELYKQVSKDSNLPSKHKLKAGCRVMLLVNNRVMNTSNGSTGEFVDFVTIDREISRWTDNKGFEYSLDYTYHGENLIVKLDDGRTVLVPRKRTVVCSGKYYTEHGDEPVNDITHYQYPIMLGYAITIHKSQGMSLDNVMIDPKGIFAKGQFYVAVSRAKFPDKIHVKGFKKEYVMADPMVVNFYKKLLQVRT